MVGATKLSGNLPFVRIDRVHPLHGFPLATWVTGGNSETSNHRGIHSPDWLLLVVWGRGIHFTPPSEDAALLRREWDLPHVPHFAVLTSDWWKGNPQREGCTLSRMNFVVLAED